MTDEKENARQDVRDVLLKYRSLVGREELRMLLLHLLLECEELKS